MGTLRFGIRAFFLGLVVGLLVAPRAGAESRRMLSERFVSFMDGLAELLALPEPPVAVEEKRPTRKRTRGAEDRPSGAEDR
jgi:hypothetical protein